MEENRDIKREDEVVERKKLKRKRLKQYERDEEEEVWGSGDFSRASDYGDYELILMGDQHPLD